MKRKLHRARYLGLWVRVNITEKKIIQFLNCLNFSESLVDLLIYNGDIIL
jgi:hypothetical protein